MNPIAQWYGILSSIALFDNYLVAHKVLNFGFNKNVEGLPSCVGHTTTCRRDGSVQEVNE